MNPEDQLAAIQDIRQMMERSVRFVSLSGLSGLFAGLYALAAGFIAYRHIGNIRYYEYAAEDKQFFILLAIATIVLAFTTAYFFTFRKAKRDGMTLWNEAVKQALINLFIPLVAGGVLCLALMQAGIFVLLAPVTLIFYGLALVNASRYTFHAIRHLGILQVGLGLINAFFLGYGLIFWMVGFGVLHIIYGIFMYIKFDRA